MTPSGILRALDARAKLAALLFVLAVCAGTPAARYPLFGGYAVLAVLALFDARAAMGALARRVAVVAPMLLGVVVAIPFLETRLAGGLSSGLVLWNVCIKSLLGVAFTCAYAETTPFAETARALEAFHCPRIIGLSLAFMHRYLAVLTDEIARMRRAAVSRGYRGRWLWHAGAVGGLAGALFLRAYERGERVYLAMRARDFQGGMPAPHTPLHGRDYCFLGAVTAMMLALRWGAG